MMNNLEKKTSNQKGIVLLITLMILTVMMVSVLALSQVIVGEVKNTLYADQSIIAFYAAESGMEKMLYELKHSRATNDFDYFRDFDENIFSNLDYAGDQSATVLQASTSDSTFVAENLTTTTFAYVDLVEPGADISAISGQFNCYRLDWSINSCFPSHASDRLEITHTSLEQGFNNSDTTKFTAVCNCAFGSNTCQPVSRDDISSDKYYRFAFRPLDGDVASTTFYAYKAVSCPSGASQIPGSATIVVSGQYKKSSHTITATLPIYSPISDIFSYVIFSEEEILKGF